MTPASVLVRVPGSTSNVGAGFDCVGIAIDRRLSATARLEPSPGAPVRIDRRGTLCAVTVPPDRDSLFAGFAAACRGAGCRVPAGLVIDAGSDIPVGRGLGSSGAATVAGALAARARSVATSTSGTANTNTSDACTSSGATVNRPSGPGTASTAPP